MRSALPKVPLPLRGRPLVEHVIQACRGLDVQPIYMVVGYGADVVQRTLGPGLRYVVQEPQLGTAHALQQVVPLLDDYCGDLLVLVGDSPLVSVELLRALWQRHRDSCAAATIVTAVFDQPPAYGRVLRDQQGRVVRIVEEAEASPEIAAIKEVITSQYCFRAEVVLPLLARIDNRNSKGEYYLTDIVGILRLEGHKVETLQVQDTRLVWAVNTPQELAQAERLLLELEAERSVRTTAGREASR